MKLKLSEIYDDYAPGEGAGPGKSSGGSHRRFSLLPVLVLLVVVVVVIAGVSAFNSLGAGMPFIAPSGDMQVRASQLAVQQYALSSNMTADAARAQAEYQARQDAIATQMAREEQERSAATTSTAWAITQTPLAAEQIRRELEIQKLQDEYFYGQYITPIKIYGQAALLATFLVLVLVGSSIAFALFVFSMRNRMQVIREERGERIIYLLKDGVIRPDLMHQPVISRLPDGTMTGSGGADDPLLQSRVAHDAAQVKMMQSLPVGAKLPGPKPDTSRALPELEIVEGVEIKPQLLADVRQSLDGEEGTQ